MSFIVLELSDLNFNGFFIFIWVYFFSQEITYRTITSHVNGVRKQKNLK